VKLSLIILLSSLAATNAASQAPALGPSSKVATAGRLQGEAPHLDGKLDDPAWDNAPWFSDFVQKDPVEGAEPQQRTEVAFLYDSQALYVGARLFGVTPWDVRAPVTRRDQTGNGEHLIVILDTYLDHRTGYAFLISSGGVRTDYYHPSDNEGVRDSGFDPVWQAEVTRDSAGWYAEMRIPFSQLRFSHGGTQLWGLNINRWMPGRNQDVYWVVVPKSETGFISRFGTLAGIDGVQPSRRLELLPYVAGDARYTSGVDPGDPFRDGSAYQGRGGVDVKMGLGPNLTLDATVNPDFGQVEADPAEVNLSAFETFFAERRPFFTEGASLLRGDGPGYFYSRRIGASPRLEATGDFVDSPHNSTILGAAKVTGRLPSGLSIGGLAAVTDAEEARVLDLAGGGVRRIGVAPLSGYLVARARQEFGASSSTVGAMLTGVERDAAPGSALAAVYSRRAYSGGVDWTLRFQGGTYELGGFLGMSYVAGDSARLIGLQTASQRYYQRPDQHYLRVDPRRRSLTGYTAAAYFARNGGKHWLYSAQMSVESPGFELNDAGRLGGSDDIDLFGNLVYRETAPGKLFHRWSLFLNASANYNYGGEPQSARITLGVNQTWKGFQNSNFSAFYRPAYQSDILTRGGPLMGAPRGWGGNWRFSSGEARTVQYTTDGALEWDDFGGWSAVARAGLSARPTSRLQLSLTPAYQRGRNTRQYLTTFVGSGTATYGSRYVFATIEQATLSAQFRLNYALSPDLTIEGYVEPFAASGVYRGLGELPASRSNHLRRYGTDGTTIARQADGSFLIADRGGADTLVVENPDFNVLSFRSNVVIRWEWRAGSTLFLVWQQDRGASNQRGTRAVPGDLWDALRARGEQFLALKVSYWIGVS
jgi:Domain of unknown function (DUF5916)